MVNNLALRIFLIGTAVTAVGAVTAYATIPAVHRTINQAIGRISAEDVPSSFDNSNNKGSFGNNNMVSASLREIKDQFPQQIIAKGNKITFLNPFQLPDGTTASYVKNLSDRFMTEELQQQAQKDPQIKDNIDLTLPKGTIFSMPADGYGFIDMGKSAFNEDTTKSTGVFFVVYDKENNITYKIGLFPLSDNNTVKYFDVKTQEFTLPADYPIDNLRGDNWQKWPQIAMGQSLVELPENEQVIMHAEGYRGKIIGPQASLVDKTIFLVTPNFLTAVDSTGVEKLLALKK